MSFVIFGVAALQIYTKLDCTQLSSNGQDALALQLYDVDFGFAIFSFNIFFLWELVMLAKLLMEL